jgi:comEA protein
MEPHYAFSCCALPVGLVCYSLIFNPLNEQEETMKRAHWVLLGTVLAVMCLLIAVQPAVAGSEEAATGQALGEKVGSAVQGEKININTANLKSLSTLPGIGPELAKRIIDYRSKSGSFKSIEELQKIKGIGEKIYTNISPLISVD